jgi:hypothetical protein
MKHPHEEVIKAWAEGAKVQIKSRNPDDRWVDIDEPDWAKHLQYRVKPTNKVVRWLCDFYSPKHDLWLTKTYDLSDKQPYDYLSLPQIKYEKVERSQKGEEPMNIEEFLKSVRSNQKLWDADEIAMLDILDNFIRLQHERDLLFKAHSYEMSRADNLAVDLYGQTRECDRLYRIIELSGDKE